MTARGSAHLAGFIAGLALIGGGQLLILILRWIA